MITRRKCIELIAVAVLVLIAGTTIWLLRPAPPPVKLNLVHFRDDPIHGSIALIHFTNCSSSSFRWDLRTLVFTKNVWVRASRQPAIEHAAATVRGHGSWTHAVPVPVEPN